MRLKEIFDDAMARRSAKLTMKSKPYPRNNAIASDISKCSRETALAILHWQERPEFREDLLARFEVGNEREDTGIERLRQWGMRVIEQQAPFEMKDEKTGRIKVRGKIDGKIEAELEGKRIRIPFDYKTIHPMLFAKMNTVQDLLDHPFFCKWPKQLWLYELGNNVDIGFIVLDNLLGQYKFIEVPLDYQGAEQVLKQCETASEAVALIQNGAATEDEALPTYHRDQTVCRQCWAFGRVCNPPIAFDGLQVLDSPELEATVTEMLSLKAAHNRYDALDRAVKKSPIRDDDEKLEKLQVGQSDTIVVGNVLIERTKRHKKGFPMPAATYFECSYTLLPAATPGATPALEERIATAVKKDAKPVETEI